MRSYAYDSETKGRGAPAAPWHYDPIGRLSGASTSPTAPPAIAYESYVDNLVAERTPGSSTVSRRHVFGPGTDEPLVWYEGASRRFLHADERGSIVAVTSDSGALLSINRYDEYGRTETTNGTYTGRFGYTGQRYFGGFGLYHYKNRIYDPRTGRFMQADPIEYDAGMNLYAYVGGDPVNSADPSGLTPQNLECTGTRLCSVHDGRVSGSVQVFGDINGFRERGNSSGGSIDLVEVNIYDINNLATPINTWWEFRMDGMSFGSVSMDNFHQQKCAGGSVCPDGSPESKMRYSTTLRAIFATPAVFKQMARAWQLSDPYGNENSKTEHGFWIFEAYGFYAPGRMLTGQGDGVWGIEYRPIGADIFFHTHPFTGAESYVPWLSGADHHIASGNGIMIIAYSHAGFMEADYRRRR
jgi:RHS repeat-associated protein